MEIKDIVNRDIVNLTNCEQEPIHIPGSIQPHGFLLGIKEGSFIIDYCSANTAEYISLFHSQLLGKTFAEAFGNEPFSELKAYVESGKMLSSTLLRTTLAGVDFVCTVHNSNGIFVFEAEPVILQKLLPSEMYVQTSQFLSYMSDTHSLKGLCQLVADGTREITGYDRVMIYRFDQDYNGEVFAESVRADLEPFLGLHYPHTDIPAQARELYMRNLLRLIVDIDYTPVPIYTLDDAADKNVDLSLSVLRSTSPIHVQYLHNMGVGATLTISLIYKKKLWGLIACHHYSPKNLTPEIRLAAQLQGHFITSQIDVRQASEEYELARNTSIAVEKMNAIQLDRAADLNSVVFSPDILKVANATGVAVLFDGQIYKNGHTPKSEEIRRLASWAATYSKNTTLVTDKLIDFLPEHRDMCQKTSGILYHSLDMNSDNCIIWFRPETKTEVHWAGDPTKSIEKDEKGLSPRRSFALWNQLVECKSKPWLQPEVDAAASYAHALQRQINLLIITLEEEKYRRLSELLRETNSELENINWISTHDLQEPLRKIQLIASRILVKEEQMPVNVQDSIKRMNDSANRMQTLLIDILKYTRLRHSQDAKEKVNMVELVEEVKGDMAEVIAEKKVSVWAENLPLVEGVPFLLKQLLSNLFANSIKYAAPEREPVIKITGSHELQPYNADDKTLYRVVHVADNGIGFEQQYAEQVFNIFTRVHTSPEFKGSGVGLALCKKIMQNHNGYIRASSQVGVGTVISLYFPAEV
ncbi:histidine kinase [Flavobacterium akiainvivens]|uniref:histidine kinase n=1 Tax=Flavobacterium akiainvivens TaxID=1202724 RepID=A0A0N0RQD1_9FLAO|nr:ATP-binding protein [Flavobacterium akiainvivens]KOS04906.1 histidine kinase [Flavobacterium akiainvivens]SFQ42366.1 Bacteriophytochrome (light-regulated signal transduction histidine kinase) [Flavobacterium akiainvivens]